MRTYTLARSQLANAVKDGAPPALITELRREYRAARVMHHLQQLLTNDLPPTAAQRRELADVLVGSEVGRAAAEVA